MDFSARQDYQKFLLEYNLTEGAVQQVTHSGVVESVEGPTRIKQSDIDGLGLFPISPIKKGQLISPAKLCGRKTEAGRYTNHSGSPNAKMVVLDKDNINLVALKDIDSEEITTNYRDTLHVQGLKRIS